MPTTLIDAMAAPIGSHLSVSVVGTGSVFMLFHDWQARDIPDSASAP